MKWYEHKNPPEAIRLHLDWWGQCRTCAFWSGARQEPDHAAACTNAASDLFAQMTWREGHCKAWDTYDIEAAVAVHDDADVPPEFLPP